MSENKIVWVHGDCLSPQGPALQKNPAAPAIWVWDEALLADYQISLKRILFMYECLLDLPVTIRRGSMVEQLTSFASQHHADTIATVSTPSPRFKAICRELADRGFRVEAHHEEPFVQIPGQVDLKRFSRYWRQAQNYL